MELPYLEKTYPLLYIFSHFSLKTNTTFKEKMSTKGEFKEKPRILSFKKFLQIVIPVAVEYTQGWFEKNNFSDIMSLF